MTTEEVRMAEAMMERVRTLAKAAHDSNVKLMIDAEHSYFQPVRPGLGIAYCSVTAVVLF